MTLCSEIASYASYAKRQESRNLKTSNFGTHWPFMLLPSYGQFRLSVPELKSQFRRPRLYTARVEHVEESFYTRLYTEGVEHVEKRPASRFRVVNQEFVFEVKLSQDRRRRFFHGAATTSAANPRPHAAPFATIAHAEPNALRQLVHAFPVLKTGVSTESSAHHDYKSRNAHI